MQTRSVDRTRSRRWRSGTRSNKHHLITHLEVCPEPKVCIIHNPRFTPPAEASRMHLTRCEQRWVDDIRAGRKHLHGDLKGSSKSMVRQRRIATIRRRIRTRRLDGLRNRNPTHAIGIDYAHQDFATLYSTYNSEAIKREIQGLAVGTAQYGR
jgi:hypothetical protein